MTITGVLSFSLSGGVCPRIVLFAEPIPRGPRLEEKQESEEREHTAKSIPDFESCGAMWVSSNALDELTRADYRSPDPPKYFPAVAYGKTPPLSLDTDSFRALEALVVRLTSEPQTEAPTPYHRWAQELAPVWEQLSRDYPGRTR